jgi:hypothetical protein
MLDWATLAYLSQLNNLQNCPRLTLMQCELACCDCREIGADPSICPQNPI